MSCNCYMYTGHANWCLTQGPSNTWRVGDIVTGKDRSYTRSIYKVASIGGRQGIESIAGRQLASAKLVSFDGKLASDIDLINEWILMIDEYRLATPTEIEESARGTKCECGNPKNPVGQGHSDWCKLFKREF